MKLIRGRFGLLCQSPSLESPLRLKRGKGVTGRVSLRFAREALSRRMQIVLPSSPGFSTCGHLLFFGGGGGGTKNTCFKKIILVPYLFYEQV